MSGEQPRSDTSGDYIPTLPVPVFVPLSTWTNLQEGLAPPVTGSVWDGGASVWDGGASVWD
jgi:hypothetical protein